MFSLLFIKFAASACLQFAASSPIQTDSAIANLDTRNTYNCTDLGAEPSTLCWDELNISDYLDNWNRTTPACEASRGDGSDCCNPQEPWTNCFLRLAYGRAGFDCTDFDPQSCTLQALRPDLDPSIAPKVGYVVRNIVTVHSLFVSYSLALQEQSISGGDSVSANLHEILKGSTEVGATLNNGNVEKALLVGLPFWGMPSVLAGGSQQINPPVNPAAAQAFVQSLQNTQAVGFKLFGVPYDVQDYMTTMNDLASDPGKAGSLLQLAFSLIMTHVPTFNMWAAHGLYSGATTALSMPPAAVGMTSAFTTYLVGEALSQSHFSATPASTTVTKEAFQNGRICTTLGDVCKDSSGKTYYWSQAFQTQYQINEPSNWASHSTIPQLGIEANAYGLLEYIETTNAYMPVLFDGAYNCTLEGKAGGSSVDINSDGSLDVACLSSLPIYFAKGSPCPNGAVYVDGKCPFGFYG